MSVLCRTCGDFIGETPFSLYTLWDGPCPGRGKHQEPQLTETLHPSGLLKRIRAYYPETLTDSSWYVYIGPPNKRSLKHAIRKFTKTSWGNYDGVVVNGEWAWYDKKLGLYGKGVDELDSLTVAPHELSS